MFEKMYQLASKTDCDVITTQAVRFEDTDSWEQLRNPYVHWSSDLLNLHTKFLSPSGRNLMIVDGVCVSSQKFLKSRFLFKTICGSM